MALPTAQLGSMTNLNVPTTIPVVAVRKEPKLWQQALLQLATQVASTAAQEGVKNEFEHENAEDFGKTPRGGFSKFWSGAAVGDKEAMQLRDIAATRSNETSREALQTDLTQQEIAARAQEGVANRGQQSDLAKREEALRMFLAQEQETGAENRLGISEDAAKVRLSTQGQQELDRLKFSDTLRKADPLYQAQTTDAQAQASQRTQQAKKDALSLQLIENQMKDTKTKGAPTAALREAFSPPTARDQAFQQAVNDPTRYGTYGKVHAPASPTGSPAMASQYPDASPAPSAPASTPVTSSASAYPSVDPYIQSIYQNVLRDVSTKGYAQPQQIQDIYRYLQDKPTGGGQDPNNPFQAMSHSLATLPQ